MQSRDTTLRLLARVMELKPHETKETLSLNEARNYIIALSKPMGEAVDLINGNLEEIKRKRKEVEAFEDDIKGFQAQLKFSGFELEVETLDYPMTVCTAEGCTTYENIGETRVRNTIYSQVCHSPCGLRVPCQTTNNAELRGCAAMSGERCMKCSHDYRVHMHIYYKATKRPKEFLSKETQKLIKEKKDLKSQKEAFVAELEKDIKELNDEKDFIYECASIFGVFLKENALIPYNDSFADYLDMLIKEEECKEKKIRDVKKIERMKREKKTYEEKKQVIMGNLASSEGSNHEVISADIHERKDKLCSLRRNGKSLKSALGTLILLISPCAFSFNFLYPWQKRKRDVILCVKMTCDVSSRSILK